MKRIIIFILMLASASVVFADNPLTSYFKKWVDETRVEISIGKLILEQFSKVIPANNRITENKELTNKLAAFVAKTGIKTVIETKVMVIDSNVPDEILLPGGILILTQGYLAYARNQEQEDFILARNAYLISRKAPLAVIKHEGMYPRFLDCVKLPEEKRSTEEIRNLIREYLKITPQMNSKQADIQGVLLTSKPETTRKAAIEMLSSFSAKIWPPAPFDAGDLPTRIAELKNTKFSE